MISTKDGHEFEQQQQQQQIRHVPSKQKLNLETSDSHLTKENGPLAVAAVLDLCWNKIDGQAHSNLLYKR